MSTRSTLKENNMTRRGRTRLRVPVLLLSRSIHQMAGLQISLECLSLRGRKLTNIRIRGRTFPLAAVVTLYQQVLEKQQRSFKMSIKGILAASDDNCFYFMSSCHHSFRKHDPPHNLKVTLCIVSGKVKHAYCTCVAGSVGFCNHVLALMKIPCQP